MDFLHLEPLGKGMVSYLYLKVVPSLSLHAGWLSSHLRLEPVSGHVSYQESLSLTKILCP